MPKPDLVAVVRETHIKTETLPGMDSTQWCDECKGDWPCDAIRAADKAERLQEAGSKICEAFEQGIFTRSTKGDGDSAWAIKLFPYLRALAVFAEGEETDSASFDESLGDA